MALKRECKLPFDWPIHARNPPLPAVRVSTLSVRTNKAARVMYDEEN